MYFFYILYETYSRLPFHLYWLLVVHLLPMYIEICTLWTLRMTLNVRKGTYLDVHWRNNVQRLYFTATHFFCTKCSFFIKEILFYKKRFYSYLELLITNKMMTSYVQVDNAPYCKLLVNVCTTEKMGSKGQQYDS